MNNPTKAHVQLVIDNLYKAKGIADGFSPVYMRQADVAFEHPCGTPMCHGGWYAIATLTPINSFGTNVDYRNGANLMGEHLGFATARFGLTRWAAENPKIWGNIYGGNMFSHHCAFGEELDENMTLQDIITHWEGVRDRLPK